MSAPNSHIDVKVRVHHRRKPDSIVVEVRVFARGIEGRLYPIPGGFVSKIEYVPKLVRALNSAIGAARAMGYSNRKLVARPARNAQAMTSSWHDTSAQLQCERAKLIDLLRKRANGAVTKRHQP
jgi:hypothetical protein